MKEKILKHLIEKYNPDAIILHGSRARNISREKSDWDFIILFNQPTEHKSGREYFLNQNIEFTIATFPVSDILEKFSTKLQKAIVLFEKNNSGTILLNEATIIYNQGVDWSEEKIMNHRLWMQGRIDGMQDHINRPEIFYKYFSDFYPRIFDYWYLILHKSYSQPIYIAIEEIKDLDNEYYELIIKLSNQSTSLEDKVIVAKEIRDILFLQKTHR